MDLNYYSMLSYANIVAEKEGLGFVQIPGLKMPFTDFKSIYVPTYNPKWEKGGEEYIKWWKSFFHEIYHNRPDNKGDEEYRKLLRKNEKLKSFVHNIIIDHRIEMKEWGEYPGRDDIMDEGRWMMYLESEKVLRSYGPDGHNYPLEAVFIFQHKGFTNWYPSFNGTDVTEFYDDKAIEISKKLDHLLDDLLTCETPLNSWNLTEKIMEIIKEDMTDEEREKEESEEGEEGTESGEEKEGGKAGEGTDKKAKESSEKTGEPKKRKIDYSEWLDDHSKKAETSANPDDKGELVTIDYSSWGNWDGKFVSYPMKEVTDFTSTASSNMLANEILGHVNIDGAASAIRRYLLVKSRSKEVNNQKKGKIDSGKLWKTVAYRGTDTASKVFRRLEEEYTLDTAVSLVVDQSGSMSGHKIRYAAAAAVAMNEIFAKLGIATRVTGFTDNSEVTLNYVYKDFSKKLNASMLAQRMAAGFWSRMSGNADGENILWEFNKIAGRREPRKIMIVLSDGQPADSKSTFDIYGYTKEVVKNIEKSKKVEIYGIGIMDYTVENIYAHNKVINNPAQISEVVINLLKERVLHP